MIKYLLVFLQTFIMTNSIIYIWYNLLNKKLNFKNKRLYISSIIITIVTILNYFFLNDILRITVITLVLMIFFRYLFKEKFNKCILTPIFTQLLIMIAEMFFVFVMCMIFDMDGTDIINTQFGQFFSNVAIDFILILFSFLPIIKKIYKFLINVTYKIRQKQLLIFSLIIILTANAFAVILYYRVDFRYMLIISSLLTIISFSVILYSFKTKTNYIRVYDKYNTTLKSLKEYEDILDRYRISNHENKNQLLTVRNMLPRSNDKIISYIDALLKSNLKDDSKIIKETFKIPEGGLRGLFYSKMLVMKNKDINYNLVFSREIKTTDMINIDDGLMLDICKIIGVYIDNAIEETSQLSVKHIDIQMYIENDYLIISISNNYGNKINIERIGECGYTTKGQNHGYGLSLTKQIILGNKRLSNEKQITKDIFYTNIKNKIKREMIYFISLF